MDICKELLSQTLKSKKRIAGAFIYVLYIYFLGKRFVVATKYLSRVIFRGLVTLFKVYMRLAIAEAKYLFKLLKMPL